MRKISFLIIMIFSLFFFWKVDTAKAVCACANWYCPDEDYVCGTPEYPTACGRTCYCNEPQCDDTRTCGGGYYVCNTGDDCCPIGINTTPEPPYFPSGAAGSADSDDPDPPPPAYIDNPGGCTATAPTNLTAVSTSSTSTNLSWTPGANGVYQALWVSTDPDLQIN